jgi:hypothetical protein
MLVAALIWKRPAAALGILLLKDSQKPQISGVKTGEFINPGPKVHWFLLTRGDFFYFIELKMKLLDIYILRFCKPEGFAIILARKHRASNLHSR